MDLAVAGGLGTGLVTAVQTYLQTQNMLQEQEMKKRLANAQTVDAVAKLWGAGGEDAVQSYGKSTGLIPQSQSPMYASTPAPALPTQGDAPVAPQSAEKVAPISGQSLQNAPQAQGLTTTQAVPQAPGLVSAQDSAQRVPAQIAQNASAPADANTPQNPITQDWLRKYNSASDRMKNILWEQVKPQYEDYAKMQTASGKLDFQKKQADLNNTGLEQFNKGVADFKSTKDTFEGASDAYGKLMKVTQDGSPKNIQSALMQVIKLDMPKQAVRFSSLEAMEQDPDVFQKWGNRIALAKTGRPMDLSIQDLQKLGTNLYQKNSEQFRAAQVDERNNAKVRGADPSYVASTYADQMDKLAKQTRKSLPAYKSPGITDVVEQAAPGITTSPEAQGLLTAAKKGGQGLLQAGKSIVSNLMPSETASTEDTRPSIAPADKVQLEQFLKQNPMGPKADRARRILGGQ